MSTSTGRGGVRHGHCASLVNQALLFSFVISNLPVRGVIGDRKPPPSLPSPPPPKAHLTPHTHTTMKSFRALSFASSAPQYPPRTIPCLLLKPRHGSVSPRPRGANTSRQANSPSPAHQVTSAFRHPKPAPMRTHLNLSASMQPARIIPFLNGTPPSCPDPLTQPLHLSR